MATYIHMLRRRAMDIYTLALKLIASITPLWIIITAVNLIIKEGKNTSEYNLYFLILALSVVTLIALWR